MSRTTVKVVPAKAVRCAIYTRKSTEDGLEQEFNSLDAQRESAEALIASQRHEGWTALPQRYDDGGFSGGSMDRPALARLMADIEAGKVDCVVVYKVDRLSRSLLDFARIMQVFESKNVSFVSVTQQFNTTRSMGRLTLNILLSFAQFEREIIGERIRDKIAAQRRAGCSPTRCTRGRSGTRTRCFKGSSRHWSRPPSSSGRRARSGAAWLADEGQGDGVGPDARRTGAAALADFDNVWGRLSPREQARLVSLLVARVDYDAGAGTIAVSFHASGIKALSQRELEKAA